MENETFYSNGKLLLTSEYLILDGARGLAIPTKYGQDLSVQKIKEPKLYWKSYDNNNQLWFESIFDLPKIIANNSNHLSNTLRKILIETQKLNTDFLNTNEGYQIKTRLSFPNNWGLGSSSTLINNIAEWAQIDAFELLNNSFGGSGYDIACAKNNVPILYYIKNNQANFEGVNFNPSFKNQLYFIHLNKKQSSRKGIENYRKYKGNTRHQIEMVNELSARIVDCKSIDEFDRLLFEHEKIIGSIINQKPIQEAIFSDYFGQLKSLGAWGGDFILATGNDNTAQYFNNKGYKTIIPYNDMIL